MSSIGLETARKMYFAQLIAFVPGLIVTEKTDFTCVFGKARVAPIKVLSIPKLKLQADLIASRLKKEILVLFSVNVTRFFLQADSKTVL